MFSEGKGTIKRAQYKIKKGKNSFSFFIFTVECQYVLSPPCYESASDKGGANVTLFFYTTKQKSFFLQMQGKTIVMYQCTNVLLGKFIFAKMGRLKGNITFIIYYIYYFIIYIIYNKPI